MKLHRACDLSIARRKNTVQPSSDLEEQKKQVRTKLLIPATSQQAREYEESEFRANRRKGNTKKKKKKANAGWDLVVHGHGYREGA